MRREELDAKVVHPSGLLLLLTKKGIILGEILLMGEWAESKVGGARPCGRGPRRTGQNFHGRIVKT